MPHDLVITALSHSHSRTLRGSNPSHTAQPEEAITLGRLERAMLSLGFTDFKEHPQMQVLAELVDAKKDITTIYDPIILAWYIDLATSLDYKTLHHILANLSEEDKQGHIIYLARRGAQILEADPKAEALLQDEIFAIASKPRRWVADLRDLFRFRFKGQSPVAQKLLHILLTQKPTKTEIFLEYLAPMTELSTEERLSLLPSLKYGGQRRFLAQLWYVEDLQLEVREAIVKDVQLIKFVPWKQTLQSKGVLEALAGQYTLCQRLLGAHGGLESVLGISGSGQDIGFPETYDPTLIIASLMSIHHPTHPAHILGPKASLEFVEKGLRLLKEKNIEPPKELIGALLNSAHKDIRERGIKLLGERSSTVHLGEGALERTPRRSSREARRTELATSTVHLGENQAQVDPKIKSPAR